MACARVASSLARWIRAEGYYSPSAARPVRSRCSSGSFSLLVWFVLVARLVRSRCSGYRTQLHSAGSTTYRLRAKVQPRSLATPPASRLYGTSCLTSNSMSLQTKLPTILGSHRCRYAMSQGVVFKSRLRALANRRNSSSRASRTCTMPVREWCVIAAHSRQPRVVPLRSDVANMPAHLHASHGCLHTVRGLAGAVTDARRWPRSARLILKSRPCRGL